MTSAALGLLVAYPREYEATIRNAADRCLDLIDFERETFGFDHEEVGRWLAERWRLPEELHIVAGRHHDRCEGVELTLLRIVHTACNLADSLGYHVAKPLVERSVAEVLSELPEQPRKAILAEAYQLRERVRARIAEFDLDDHPHVPVKIEMDAPVAEDPMFVIELPATDEDGETQPRRTMWARFIEFVFSLFVAPAPQSSPPAEQVSAPKEDDPPRK